MVSLGEANSRLKDFYDVWFLARAFDFDGATLAEAIRATFARRGTKLLSEPLPLSEAFGRDEARQAQWRAFLRRSGLTETPEAFPEVVGTLAAFLRPVTRATTEMPFAAHWHAPGPWQDPRLAAR